MPGTQYPRPEVPERAATDRKWGRVIVGYSAAETLICSFFVFNIFSGFGLANSSKPTQEADGPEVFAAMIMLFGAVLALLGVGLSVIRLFGGRGILKGNRSGFLWTAIPSGLVALLTLPSILAVYPLIVLGPNTAFLVYTIGRLRGQWGPAPV